LELLRFEEKKERNCDTYPATWWVKMSL
jgi:hypothetical protein